MPEILPRINPKIMDELIEYAKNISINLKPAKKIPLDYDDLEEIPINVTASRRKTSVLQQLLERLDTETDWKIKSETI